LTVAAIGAEIAAVAWASKLGFCGPALDLRFTPALVAGAFAATAAFFEAVFLGAATLEPALESARAVFVASDFVALVARDAFFTIVFATLATGTVALAADFFAFAALLEAEAAAFFAFLTSAGAPLGARLRAGAFFFATEGDFLGVFLEAFLAVVLRVVTRFVGMELPRPPGRRFGRRSRQLLRLA
jgi:hypothetical protein